MKLKEMIDFERNEQLDQFSNIYFKKLRKNVLFDEL